MTGPDELLRILLFQLVKQRPELAVPLIERSGLLEQILGAMDTARDPIEDPPPVDEGDGDVDSRELPERPTGPPAAENAA